MAVGQAERSAVVNPETASRSHQASASSMQIRLHCQSLQHECTPKRHSSPGRTAIHSRRRCYQALSVESASIALFRRILYNRFRRTDEPPDPAPGGSNIMSRWERPPPMNAILTQTSRYFWNCNREMIEQICSHSETAIPSCYPSESIAYRHHHYSPGCRNSTPSTYFWPRHEFDRLSRTNWGPRAQVHR